MSRINSKPGRDASDGSIGHGFHSLASTSSRRALVHAAKERLARHGAPRLQMSLMVALTTGSAFLTSVVLQRIGVSSLGFRYAILAATGYLVFLGLLRLWLAFQHRGQNPKRRQKTRQGDSNSGFDVIDLGFNLPKSGSSAPAPASFGGGGHFMGAGGGGTWGNSVVVPGLPGGPLNTAQSSASFFASVNSESSSSGGSGLSLPDLGDEGGPVILVLILLAVIAAILFGLAFFVINSAPILLAELLVDGAIATGAVQLLKPEGGWWLGSVLKRTWWVATLTIVLAGGAGVAIQTVQPNARTIGDLWRMPLPASTKALISGPAPVTAPVPTEPATPTAPAVAKP